VLATSRKCYACHADEKVSDVLHLSRKTRFQTSKNAPLGKKDIFTDKNAWLILDTFHKSQFSYGQTSGQVAYQKRGLPTMLGGAASKSTLDGNNATQNK